MRSYRKYYLETVGAGLVVFHEHPQGFPIGSGQSGPDLPVYFVERRRKSDEVNQLNIIAGNFWWTDPAGSGVSGFTLLQSIFDIDVYKDHPLN